MLYIMLNLEYLESNFWWALFKFYFFLCLLGLKGLDMGIVTMKKGEVALFTLPSDIAYGNGRSDTVPLGSVVQFEVELILSLIHI